METAGAALRQAREHAGLSAEQIAERTKFKLYRIEALENGDFKNLPNGIYLDGIVRAYAHELAIDPEPMVERVRLERGTLPGDSPIPFQEPVEFERPPAVHEATVMAHASAPAAPARSSLALGALALFAVLGWGAYFYEASRAADRDTPGNIYAALTAQVAPHAAPIAFGADLFSPQDDLVSPHPERLPASQRTPPPAARNTVRVTNATGDLAGSWKLATQVESSSYARFEGLLLGYEIQLEQHGDRVTGIGRKVIENGSGIGARAQTPIAVSGIVDGDRLTLNFIEGGAQRSTEGTFVLVREADGTLRGRFSSNAARSAGSVEARRVR